MSGPLVMTLVVRDEDDILDAHLRYHLERGVDHIYAADHSSVDETPDILRRYESDGVLTLSHVAGEVIRQSQIVTGLARHAWAVHRPAWVINNDADEFWWPLTGDLKATFARIPAEFTSVVGDRHDFPPRVPADGPFEQRMIWRPRVSLTPRGHPLAPKVAHRGAPDATVAQGAHGVAGAAFRPDAELALALFEVLHFPARSYEQFERKVIHTGRSYELQPELDPQTGGDQRMLMTAYREGGLPAFYDGWALTDAAVQAGERDATLVRDERLRAFLAGEPVAPSELQADALAQSGLAQAAELHEIREERDLLVAAEGALRADLALLAAELDAERAEHRHTVAELSERSLAVERLRNSLAVRTADRVKAIVKRPG